MLSQVPECMKRINWLIQTDVMLRDLPSSYLRDCHPHMSPLFKRILSSSQYNEVKLLDTRELIRSDMNTWAMFRLLRLDETGDMIKDMLENLSKLSNNRAKGSWKNGLLFPKKHIINLQEHMLKQGLVMVGGVEQ